MMEGRENQRSLSAHHFEGLVHILFHSPGAKKYAFYRRKIYVLVLGLRRETSKTNSLKRTQLEASGTTPIVKYDKS